MKPPIKIQTPCDDKTEFENFEELTSKLLRVSKEEFDAKRLADEQERRNKRTQSKQLKQTTK